MTRGNGFFLCVRRPLESSVTRLTCEAAHAQPQHLPRPRGGARSRPYWRRILRPEMSHRWGQSPPAGTLNVCPWECPYIFIMSHRRRSRVFFSTPVTKKWGVNHTPSWWQLEAAVGRASVSPRWRFSTQNASFEFGRALENYPRC